MYALPAPIEVFFSYADADEPLREELEKHLSQLCRDGLITTWYKRQITPGTDWSKVIDEHLKQASIILLLVSSDFLASDYCYQVEMKRALERHEAGQARVIPILIRSCDWSSAPFAHIQRLPTGDCPITKWLDRDEAWTNVTQGIRRAIEDLTSSRTELLEKLEGGNESMRFAAAQALWALKDPATAPAIIIRLEIEPDPTTRYWLAYALGRIGGKLALDALQDAKATEQDQFVQRGIDAGLEELKGKNI